MKAKYINSFTDYGFKKLFGEERVDYTFQFIKYLKENKNIDKIVN